MLILSSSFLTSCEIPFEKFILSSGEVKKDIKIEKLDLNKHNLDEKYIVEMQGIVDNVFNEIADKKFYLSNYHRVEVFHKPIIKFLENNFYNDLSSGNRNSDLKKVVDNIYYRKNTSFKKANIIDAGTYKNGYFFNIEVVSIDDGKEFNTEIIKLITDYNKTIIDTEIIGEMNSVSNTTKPLNEDSLIPTNHNLFLKEYEKFLGALANEKLYNELLTDNNGEGNFQLNTLVNNLNIKYKNNADLIELFKLGKGNFKNGGVTGYRYSDKDATAITTYIVSYPNEDKQIDFEVEFSRVNNKILKITKK